MGSLELNVGEDNMSDQSNNETDLKGWFSQSSSKRFVDSLFVAFLPNHVSKIETY